jgi:energy-coupling factor transport system ATP-binding protein
VTPELANPPQRFSSAPPPRPVRVEAAGWGWRHAGRLAWALRGVDLRIEPGERVLLVGPSGAGKSTLLLGLAGLLDASGGAGEEGQLHIDGARPQRVRDRVGLLFQDPETQLLMGRAGDDVAFGLENRGVPTDAIWPRVDAALEMVDFRYGRQRPTTALSGGEKQRLALAGTLALRPGLLLLDEPTANLDPEGAEQVRDLLRMILERGGATMILVEHRVDEAIPLVDRVVALEASGGIVADGDPTTVFSRHGSALEAAGVWLPGHRPTPPPRRERPPSETLVLAEGAGFTYPGARQPAVSHAEVQLRSAQALAISGPNGSGKTTLGLLLAGLLRPTAGAVVSGESLSVGHGHEQIWRWPAHRLVHAIGMVFQEPEHQFLTGSALAELAIGPIQAGLSRAEARRRAVELLERFHLGHLAQANPFTLSGGEKRRLSVATALAAAPAAVILDEPTFGQDARTWSEMLDLLAALRDSGHAICVVTHDRDFANALADRTLRLEVPAGRMAV